MINQCTNQKRTKF